MLGQHYGQSAQQPNLFGATPSPWQNYTGLHGLSKGPSRQAVHPDLEPISKEMLNTLIEPAPPPNMQNPFQMETPASRDPIPKWDGKNAAKGLRPWLRALRMWRQCTGVPAHRHGVVLHQSFPFDSWMSLSCEDLPEQTITSPSGYDIILAKILQLCKPYLDVETELQIEQFFYTIVRAPNELMSNYITRKQKAHDDLSASR